MGTCLFLFFLKGLMNYNSLHFSKGKILHGIFSLFFTKLSSNNTRGIKSVQKHWTHRLSSKIGTIVVMNRNSFPRLRTLMIDISYPIQKKTPFPNKGKWSFKRMATTYSPTTNVQYHRRWRS